MEPYPKIQTVFFRDPETKFNNLLHGQFSIPEFERLKDEKWMFTEKVDGTNVRVIFSGGKLTFKGRGEKSIIPQFLVQRLDDIFYPKIKKLHKVMRDNGVPASDPICFYGEGYGGKIQNGSCYSKSNGFVVFDVKVGDVWLDWDGASILCENIGIDKVPIIGFGTLSDMVYRVSKGHRSRWGDFIAEGIVARPLPGELMPNGDPILVKVKHRDFPNEQ